MAKKIKILDEAKIRKKYPGANKASIVIDDNPLWLPSENLALNWQLGGGVPYGKVIEVFGYESVGKSLLALGFAKTTIKLGGAVLWVDAEGSWSNHWARQNGVDPEDVDIYVENSIELISDWLRDMCYLKRSKLTNNEPIFIVIDSLAALDKQDNTDKDMTDAKAEMGNRAKAISDFWRTRAPLFYKLGVCVMPINQVREKLGASMYEEATKTVGGAHTQFTASQRLALIRSTQIKDGDGRDSVKIGQHIIMDVKKNKVAPPAPRVKTEVYFRENKWGYVGYSKYAGLFDILLNEGVISRKGNTIYFDDKMVARGEASFLNMLHDNKETRSKILSRSSINTLSRTRKRLESIAENQFPLTGTVMEDDDE